jgi:hypothetical protein
LGVKDMPLKVLHKMLVDPPIAIVGLSNWKLDPAKVGREVALFFLSSVAHLFDTDEPRHLPPAARAHRGRH